MQYEDNHRKGLGRREEDDHAARSLEALQQAVEHLQKTVPDANAIRAAVAAGVHDGMASLLSEPEKVTTFWETGFNEMTKHVATQSSQWIGKRLLTAAITAITVWGITWLVTTGRFKG
jgi:Asp-tRNA(Asn)/Glu-tRNA(Gln) amidotransferase B subunit